MKYDSDFFDTIVDRRGTACEKWDCISQREGRELLPMWVADMDFACPDEVVKALMSRAAHPVYGYTEQTEAAVDAMLGFMQRRHGVKLTRDQQALLPCVVTGLRAAVRTLTKPGDKVIIQPPVYGPFYRSITENGREIVENPLIRDEKGRYSMDFDDLERKCAQGAKLMLLCNPHNPASRPWNREEIARLTDILGRYGVTLISDEIHEDFVFDKDAFTPVLNVLTGEDAPVAALTSASKTFNLAGLQQAVLLTRNQEIKRAMTEDMNQAGVVSGNIFALIAAEAAYAEGDAWLDGMLDYLRDGRRILVSELQDRLPKAVLTPLEATYLGWLDLRAYGMSTEELTRRTHAAGVAFTEGTFFGKQLGEGFLRINIACPHSQTREAMARLEKAIKG